MLKRAAALEAASLIKDSMVIGLGTGSTVAFLIEIVGQKIQQGLNIKAVATSFESQSLCFKAGIPLIDLSLVSRLDLAIDGADEVTKDLSAIKGGGAAHAVEKIVASMADEFVIIADSSKLVENLGLAFPVPVEIMRQSLGFFLKKVEKLELEPKVRTAAGKDGPIITENGNIIVDLKLKKPQDMADLNLELKLIPGVLETGLFLGIAKKALIATENGIVTITDTNKTKSSGRF